MEAVTKTKIGSILMLLGGIICFVSGILSAGAVGSLVRAAEEWDFKGISSANDTYLFSGLLLGIGMGIGILGIGLLMDVTLSQKSEKYTNVSKNMSRFAASAVMVMVGASSEYILAKMIERYALTGKTALQLFALGKFLFAAGLFLLLFTLFTMTGKKFDSAPLGKRPKEPLSVVVIEK